MDHHESVLAGAALASSTTPLPPQQRCAEWLCAAGQPSASHHSLLSDFLCIRLKALSGIFFQEFVLLISQLPIFLVSATVHLSKMHRLFAHYSCCFRTVS